MSVLPHRMPFRAGFVFLGACILLATTQLQHLVASVHLRFISFSALDRPKAHLRVPVGPCGKRSIRSSYPCEYSLFSKQLSALPISLSNFTSCTADSRVFETHGLATTIRFPSGYRSYLLYYPKTFSQHVAGAQTVNLVTSSLSRTLSIQCVKCCR
jgi:hypothetical protein